MLGVTRWIFGSIQVAAAVVTLAAVAHGRAPRDMDRGSLDQLMADTTRYLDPQMTGSLRNLIETGATDARAYR